MSSLDTRTGKDKEDFVCGFNADYVQFIVNRCFGGARDYFYIRRPHFLRLPLPKPKAKSIICKASINRWILAVLPLRIYLTFSFKDLLNRA